MGEDYGTWCYVSSSCKALNCGDEGHPFNMKICTDADAKLRDNSPRQLASFAMNHHIDLGLLHKMSYPRSSHLWPEVSAFWGINGTPQDLALSVRKEMEEVVAAGTPHSFDIDANQHPPHRIVVGRTVFAVHNRQVSLVTADPGTWQMLECLQGCDLPTAQ